MPISFHKQVTTPEALASSIDIDHHVRRWFTLLVVQPAFRNGRDKTPQIQSLYAALRKIVTGQCFLYTLLWGNIGAGMYSGHNQIVGLGLLFTLPLFYLDLQLKKCVRKISMAALLKDFADADLRQKTLYQISEFYSRQHCFPSIVDNIFTWDNMTRMIVIAITILAAPIIPLIIKVYRVNFILTFLSLLALCYLIFATIHTFRIYRYLQQSSE